MQKTTDAQKRAHKTYISKFSRVEIRMETAERERIQAHAAAHGESVNSFINRAIRETMDRDKAQAGE